MGTPTEISNTIFDPLKAWAEASPGSAFSWIDSDVRISKKNG